MRPRKAFRGGVSVLGILLAAGCGGKAAHPNAAASPEPIGVAPNAASPEWKAHREEVAALVEKATLSATEGDRTAAALAAADRGTGPLARTIAAIDAARDVCVTNLRNAETTAYKASIARVADGQVVGVQMNFEQGSLENTGRPLDVAIQGNGFLKVQVADSIGGGVAYTRNGNLFVNNTGLLVLGMGDGYMLTPPITVPPNASDVSISQDGRVSVLRAGDTTKTNIGLLKLLTFINPHGLRYQGGSMFTETEASGPPTDHVPGNGGTGQLLQGFLEASNVDMVRERLRLQFLLDWKAVLMKVVDDRPAVSAGNRTVPGNAVNGN